LAQYTAFLAVAHVFVIMEIGSRRIVHVNVTTNPTLSWVKQQIRLRLEDSWRYPSSVAFSTITVSRRK
jgi:hypothetical protein